MQFHGTIRAAIFWMAAFPTFGSEAAPHAHENGPLYDQLVTLNNQLLDESGPQRATTIIERYRGLVAGVPVCSHTIVDTALADDLFRATAFAEFYSLSESDVNTLGCLYRELLQSGKATDWHALTYAGALVSVARFSDANRLLQKVEGERTPLLPQINPASDLVADEHWRFLSLESASRAVVRNWTPAPERMQIIIVVHPACAFSTRALTEIGSRDDLRWLRERVLLLVPPDSSLPSKGILGWNSAHPDLPMQRMYTRDDWQPLTSLDTPTFYLMQGIDVVQTFEGWPNSEGVAQMEAALLR